MRTRQPCHHRTRDGRQAGHARTCHRHRTEPLSVPVYGVHGGILSSLPDVVTHVSLGSLSPGPDSDVSLRLVPEKIRVSHNEHT